MLAVVLAVILTAVPFDPSDPFTWIGASGVAVAVAFVLALFVRGLIIPGHIYQNALDTIKHRETTIEEKDEVIAGLHELVENKALEVLLRANTNLEAVSDYLKERTIQERLEREREHRR